MGLNHREKIGVEDRHGRCTIYMYFTNTAMVKYSYGVHPSLDGCTLVHLYKLIKLWGEDGIREQLKGVSPWSRSALCSYFLPSVSSSQH